MAPIRMVARRLLNAIPVLFIVSIVVFSLLHMAPGDPAVRAAGGQTASIEDVERVRTLLGLDEPIGVQYITWVGDVMRGDFGTSLFSSRSVADALLSGLPVTLSLALGAVLIALLLAIPMGVYAAARPKGAVDRLVSAVATVGIATPSFLVALILVGTFALWLGWLPGGGYVAWSLSTTEWLRRLALPCSALAVPVFSELVRHVRAAVRDVLGRGYIRTARAKGVPERIVTLKHAAKPAAIPIVTVLGLQLRRLFGGTIVIEAVFALPGIGATGLKAVLDRDYPVIQGYAILTVLVVIVVNLVVDLSYLYFNPKVRQA